MTSLDEPSLKWQQVGEPYRPKERKGSSFLSNQHWKNQNLLQAKVTPSQYSVTNITSQAASSLELCVPEVRVWRQWKQGPFHRKGPANTPLPLQAQGLAVLAASPTTGMAVCQKILIQRSASQTA